MRYTTSLILLLATLALAPGCDSIFAQRKTTRWLSKEALMGLTVQTKGDEIVAAMYVFDDAVKMPDPKEVVDGDDFGGLPLAAGIVDAESKTLVFPLQTVNLVQANSARLLRQNGASYVEFDLDFSRPELAGRWRDGAKPPKFTRTFVRCGP